MDRVASLLRLARETRASVFRSLPWGYRVAHLFTVLSSGTVDVFAKTVGWVFLHQKVEGLEPPPGWTPRTPINLTPGAPFAKFANEVFRRCLGKFRDAELVEDAMSEVMSKFAMKPDLLTEGTPLQSAQGLISKSVMNLCLNKIKSKNLRRTDSLYDTDGEGEEHTIDVEDPKALRSLDDLLSREQMAAIKRDIAKILPWAPAYLDMVLDGHDDEEILGNPKRNKPSLLADRLNVPVLTNPSGVPMSLAMWSKSNGYKDKIHAVIRKHMSN